MNKKLFAGIAALFFSITSFAQDIKSVKITDVQKMMDTATVPLVVNFWATWCGPCVRELPYLQKQIAAVKNSKVRLILVSLDFEEDYPATLKKFVKGNKLQGEVVWLNETDASYFCPKIDESWEGVIPATMMINNKTKFKQFYSGQLTEAQVKKALKELISE